MKSVMHCKFIKIVEGKKKDNSKYFRLFILDETEKNVQTIPFFISNEIALNLHNCPTLANIAISFDIYFTSQQVIRYKINQIVIEK